MHIFIDSILFALVYVISIDCVESSEVNRNISSLSPQNNCIETNTFPSTQHVAFEISEKNFDNTKFELIKLYWRNPVKTSDYIGDDFGYGFIERFDGKGRKNTRDRVSCREIERTCARAAVLRYDSNSSYYYQIGNRNKCDDGSKLIDIVVPPRSDLLPKPLLLSVIRLADVYNVTWTDVDRNAAVNSTAHYKLFWCSNPCYFCSSIEDSMIVSRNLNSVIIEPSQFSSKDVLKFGITYNEGNRTSSLLWSNDSPGCLLQSRSRRGH